MKIAIIIILLTLLLTSCGIDHSVTGEVISKDAANLYVTIDRDGESRTIEVTGELFNTLEAGIAYRFKSNHMGSGYRIFTSAEEVK